MSRPMIVAERLLTCSGLLTAAIAIILIVGPSVRAQTHPSFTGDWILDPDKTAVAAGTAPAATSGGGGPMTTGPGPAAIEYKLTLTATSLTVDRVGAATPQTYIYKLDGSESVNTVGPTTSKTKSHWDGSTIVTEGTRTVTTSQGDVTSSFKELRSLDREGSMHVEESRQTSGQDPTTSFQVFVRK
jgi:hypothetical protein